MSLGIVLLCGSTMWRFLISEETLCLARKDQTFENSRPEFLQLGVAKRPMQKYQFKFNEFLKKIPVPYQSRP